MNLPFYIAWRYLFSKKSHNAINIISGISVCGISLATVAMVCTLSVINGFQEMVEQFFTAFDPELKITSTKGKTFAITDAQIQSIKSMPEVEVFMGTLEEQVMLQYKERQMTAIIKGVEDNFEQLTAIDSILYGTGQFILHDEVADYGIPGAELMTILGTGVEFIDPIRVYAPRRDRTINAANPANSFTTGRLFSPGVIFAVNQQEYDANYILASLAFVRKLFNYQDEVTAVELRLHPQANTAQVQKRIQEKLGNNFKVMNRYEQQEDVFRIMKVEKLVSYLFLTFILLIASFNIMGSISMLVIDKKDDAMTLRNLGASNRLIGRIFLFEGWLISAAGAVAGIIAGLALCLLQQYFGIIKLGNGENTFVIDTYPVSVETADVILVAATVLAIGFLAIRYPVRYFCRRLLP